MTETEKSIESMSAGTSSSNTPSKSTGKSSKTSQRHEEVNEENEDIYYKMLSQKEATGDRSEKFERAQREREEANAKFRQGDLQGSVDLWRHALKLCYELSVEGVNSGTGALYDLESCLQLNLAAAMLKTKNYSRCIEHCERVLQHDPLSIKALHRLASAHIHLQEWKEAREVIARLQEAQPNNSQNDVARLLLRQVQREEMLHARQEKALWKHSFKKSQEKLSALVTNNTTAVVVDENERLAGAAGAAAVAAKAAGVMLSPQQEQQKQYGEGRGGVEATTSSVQKEDDWLWPVQYQREDFSYFLWRQPHTLESLTEECNFPLTRALPLTILFALTETSKARQNAAARQLAKAKAVKELSFGAAAAGTAHRTNTDAAVIAQSEVVEKAAAEITATETAAAESAEAASFESSRPAVDVAAAGGLGWWWADMPFLKKDVLCMHLIGATSSHEMGCKFTTILERWPLVKTLILVLVGFLGSEGKLETTLERGKLNPPAVVRTEDGREQHAIPFKGTYEEFVQAVPEVLTERSCVLYPDVAVLSTPLLSRTPQQWQPCIELLLNAKVLCVVTVSGSWEHERLSRALLEDQEFLEEKMHARILVSTRPNRFPILLRPPSDDSAAAALSFEQLRLQDQHHLKEEAVGAEQLALELHAAFQKEENEVTKKVVNKTTQKLPRCLYKGGNEIKQISNAESAEPTADVNNIKAAAVAASAAAQHTQWPSLPAKHAAFFVFRGTI